MNPFMKRLLNQIAGTAAGIAVVVSGIALLSSCGGDKGTETKNPPRITQFSASPTDITPGYSSTITYAASGADSLVLTPGTKLANATSGTITVSPPVPIKYILKAFNSDGSDSDSLMITMSTVVAEITSLTLSDDTLIIGSNVTLSWQALRADSIVVSQGIGKLADPVSGQITFSLSQTTTFRVIAYNNIANDTVNFTVTVQVPTQLRLVNGQYFKTELGTTTQVPEMRLWVADAQSNLLTRAWIHFTLIEGDGTLSVDSAQVDGTGSAFLEYDFSGMLAHAVIRARVLDLDSVDLNVRSSAILPGEQAQFVRLTDTYEAVNALNGSPDQFDIPADFWLLIANYETSLGVVVVMEDINRDSTFNSNEPVLEVIVNDNEDSNPANDYKGTTVDGLGVGSLITEFITVYGAATSVVNDTDTWRYEWDTIGLTVYTSFEPIEANRVVREIHVLPAT
jgi:hypothetical protein